MGCKCLNCLHWGPFCCLFTAPSRRYQDIWGLGGAGGCVMSLLLPINPRKHSHVWLDLFYKLWNVGLIWDITIKLGFCGRGSKPRWVQKCSHRGSMSRLLISAVSNKDSQMSNKDLQISRPLVFLSCKDLQMSNKNLQKSRLLISVSNKDLQMLRLLVFVSSKDLQMSNLWQVELSLKVELQMSITPLRRIKTPDSWRWYKILQPQWKDVLAPKYSSFEEIVKSFPAN